VQRLQPQHKPMPTLQYYHHLKYNNPNGEHYHCTGYPSWPRLDKMHLRIRCSSTSSLTHCLVRGIARHDARAHPLGRWTSCAEQSTVDPRPQTLTSKM
jgi:hypothetical protein